jgi:receptor-type tyrosine-protein phosphatase F
VVRIRAYTKQGAGQFSEKLIIETERDMGRAPMQVQAIATSEQTVEVWWEPGNSNNISMNSSNKINFLVFPQKVPSRGKLIGYKIFYTMTAVEGKNTVQEKKLRYLR